MDGPYQKMHADDQQYYVLVGMIVSFWNDIELSLRLILAAMTGLAEIRMNPVSLLRHLGNRAILETIEDIAVARETDEAIRKQIVSLCKYVEICRINRNYLTHARVPIEGGSSVHERVLEPDQRRKVARKFEVDPTRLNQILDELRFCQGQAEYTYAYLAFRDSNSREMAEHFREALELEFSPPESLLSRPFYPPSLTLQPQSFEE